MSQECPSVIPISFGMVKAYLLRGERPILVDTGMFRGEAIIAKTLEGLGIAPREMALILITHGHTDHFGSVAAVKEMTGAPVAIHRLDAQALREGRNFPLHGVGIVGRLMQGLSGRSRARPLEPDALIEDEMSLEPFGVRGRVVHTPGHTPGSVSVLLADGQAIIGDLTMGAMTRPARPGYPFFADDLAQLRASIATVLAASPTRIWAAHGGPFDPEDVARAFS